jgi:hypothetical protein
MNSIVGDLTVYNGELIAGGGFTTAGGVPANYIARWDGSSWQPFGSGMNSSVSALTVYNGEIVAGGGFNIAGSVTAYRIASWDGSFWRALGIGIGGDDFPGVHIFSVYNDELIAGGRFNTAGGVDANNIARWDGSSWQTLGDGTDDVVSALTVYNNQLIAGGLFTAAGGIDANYIARWDGSSWQPLGSGMSNYVYGLTVYNGELIAGGDFTTAGGVPANRIVRWNGSFWQALGSGMNNWVYPLTVYNGELIAGGSFTNAGGVDANYIARWDGSSWQPLGSGMNDWVRALTVYNGELIAGGDFTTAGGIGVSHIARWNGSSWQALGSGFVEVNTYVLALTVYNGELIVGGRFTTAGGVPASKIARWDGSSWQPLGSGISGDSYSTWVEDLTVYNGELIAGGNFTTAGGRVSAYWARWGPVNQPPVACIAGGDQIIEAGSNCETSVILDGSCSSDEDSTEGTNSACGRDLAGILSGGNDIASFEWYEQIDPCDANSNVLLGSGEVIECNLPLGEHNIILEVTDEAGESDSNEITVTVEDVTPPVFSLSVEPSVLRPANHKMVRIEPVWETSDNCDDDVEVSLVGITVEDKSYSRDDIQITEDGTIYLRAERSGKGSGRIYPPRRIYTITYQAVDDSNNVTLASATVTVPHDRR